MSYKDMKLEIFIRLVESECIVQEEDPEEKLAIYEQFACLRDMIHFYELMH